MILWECLWMCLKLVLGTLNGWYRKATEHSSDGGYDPGLIESTEFDWFSAKYLEDALSSTPKIQPHSVIFFRVRVEFPPNVNFQFIGGSLGGLTWRCQAYIGRGFGSRNSWMKLVWSTSITEFPLVTLMPSRAHWAAGHCGRATASSNCCGNSETDASNPLISVSPRQWLSYTM